MKTRPALLCLLASCTADTVAVHVVDHAGAPEDTDEAFAVADEILGVTLIPSPSAPIDIEIVRVLDPGPCAWTAPASWCDVDLRTPPVGVKLAHELGHALGLEHVETAGNLMTISSSGRELTEWQRRTIGHGAWSMEACP